MMAKRKPTWLEEVTEAQQEPLFIGWMSTMDRDVRAFRAEVFPDLGGDQYSLETLQLVERRLLEIFPSYDGIAEVPNAAVLIDGFIRFVGEAFVHGLGGKWMNIPQPFFKPEEHVYCAVVATGERLEETREWQMMPVIKSAIHRRTGSEFTRLWDGAIKDMRENGRDPSTNATDLIAQLIEHKPLADVEELSPKRPDNDLYAFLPAGRTVTQAEVRAIFDRQFAGTGLVVSEVPFRVVATDRKSRQQIGVVIEIAGTDTGAAEYIPMILKGHPHPRKAAFEGATEQLHLFTLKDPREGLAEHLMELAEAFEEDFGALAYLPNAGTYLFE